MRQKQTRKLYCYVDETHLRVVEREPGRMYCKCYPPCLPRDEGDASKTDEHIVRAGNRSDQVAAVELHHFVACALSGVTYLDGHLNQPGSTRRLHGKAVVCKGGVAQPVPEGEQWCRGRVGVVAIEHGAVTSGTVPNMVWDLADRAWHAHRQTASRIYLPGQHICEAVATLLTCRK